MRTHFSHIVVLSLLVLVSASQMAVAQVATGTPPFNSFGGGPFDVVNLANLNVHFTIPILHKAGRGIPFSFDLTYDSSIWKQVTVGTTRQWTPAAGWGWQQKGSWGRITYSTSSSDCQYFVSYIQQWFTAYTAYTYSSWTFTDDSGVAHPFNVQTKSWSGSTQPGTNCSSAPPNQPTASGTATDGSGYTISITGYTNAVVTSPGGMKVDNTSGTSFTDTNGNKITSDLYGHYYDTLSSTTPVLTVSGGDFAYAAPGGTAHTIVNYRTYTVKTNFGATGTQEYGPLAISLVDNVQLADGTRYIFTYEPTPGTCTPLANTYPTNCVTARLASVTFPTGGQIAYAYTGGTNGIQNDGSAAGLTRTITPGGAWTYTRSIVSGSSATTVTSPPDATNPGSAGNVTVINFLQTGTGFYERQRQVYQGAAVSGNLLLTTVTCYNTATCPNSAVTLPITKVDSRLQYPNGGLQGRTVTTYTTSGLVTQVDRYPFSASLPTTPLRTTSISYASLGNGISNRPSTVSIGGSAGVLSATTYYYDESGVTAPTAVTPQHVSITGARGNLTHISRSSAPSTFLNTTLHYYDTGMVSTSTDVNNATTTYVYGDTISCGNSFPTEVDLPITGLKTYATWDCTGGVPLTSKDVNGQTTTTTYTDPYFWRPASTTDPASNTTSLSYPPANGTAASVVSSMSFGSSVIESWSTMDALGRPYLSQQREGPGLSAYDSTQVNFDNLGRPYQSTMPFVQGAGQGTSSAPKTETKYDALGRVLQTTDAAGGYVKYTYNQNVVMQEIGPAPVKKKELEYDAIGRLISVCELTTLPGSASCGQAIPANGYKTTYAYDSTVVNNLYVLRTTVTQNAQLGGTQPTRTYLRDQFGRLVSETNLENATTSYSYDSGPNCSGTYTGDLVQVVDANGNTTCYTYDAMHRLTTTSYSGTDASVTDTKTLVYDSATVGGVTMSNTLGRLAEAYTGPVGSKKTDLGFSYSVRGELVDTYQSSPHSGTPYYHVTTGYWANGALASLSSNISSIPAQTFGVDGMGRPTSVTATSVQNPNVVTNTTYNLATLQTTLQFGSGDTDVFTSNPNTGRMSSYQFNVGNKSLTGTLSWNNNGSLDQLAIVNTIPGTSDTQTCSYIHDDLSRIASAACANGSTTTWNQTFSYDALGNIKKDAGSGPGQSFMPVYDPQKSWITTLPNSTPQPTTDPNGRMTWDGTHNYTWDAENRMVSVDTTTVTYDALGRMVEKNAGGVYTQIVYGPVGNKYALMSGQTLQKAFIPLPTGAQAVYNSSGQLAYYRHPDHLGSSRLATTPNRTLYSSTAYAPFGETYAETGTRDRSFTGKDEDTTSGMYDFLARRYSPVQGRWLSPDPAGLGAVDPSNPQTWNRYAYVGNNPLALIDPLGEDAYSGCSDRTPWCYYAYYGSIFYSGSSPWWSDASQEGGPWGPQSDPTFLIVQSAGSAQSYFDTIRAQIYQADFDAYLQGVSDAFAEANKLAALKGCIKKQFGVKLVSFSPTVGNGLGDPSNRNGSATIQFGSGIGTITNDIFSKSLADMPRSSSRYTHQGGFTAGFTDPKNPWTNYTENSRSGQAAVNVQIWELGNSISVIQRTMPAHMDNPDQDPGGTTYRCYAAATGGDPKP